jgi:FlaA1/EpsC-like NDP-sugar epimerase
MVCGSPEADARHPDTFQNAAQGFTKRGYFGERPCNDGRIFRKTKITGRRRMKKLYVIGAGGFGRKVLTWAMQCHSFEKEWTISGFIDDDEHLVGRKIHGYEVVATTNRWMS